MSKIIVVGSINQDITLFMENIPVAGETVIANDLSTSLGGKGANQAVTIARMGGDISFVGAVGNDKASEEIIKKLEEENINIIGIMRSELNTGSAYISIDEKGNNSIIVYPGANFAITTEHLYKNIQLFKEAEYCLLQLEIPMMIIKKVIKICQENNVKVFLNPAPYNKEIDNYILENIDFYIPNESEFLHTIGYDVNLEYDLNFYKEKGLEFSNKYSLDLIITLGSRGSMLITDNEITIIPAKDVIPIDTTAAGDSFIGGFLAGLSKENEMKKSLEFATNVAALTITRVGAISALPYLNELK